MEATPPSYALLFQLPLTLTILIKLYKPRTFPKIASTCSTKTRMEKVYPSKWNIDAKREKDRSVPSLRDRCSRNARPSEPTTIASVSFGRTRTASSTCTILPPPSPPGAHTTRHLGRRGRIRAYITTAFR